MPAEKGSLAGEEAEEDKGQFSGSVVMGALERVGREEYLS